MRRLRGCLTVVFLFGCGFLVGGFLGAMFGWTALFNKIVKGGPMAVQEVIVDRLRGDLRLKGEKRSEARKIVQETALELDAATREVRPKVAEILDRAEDRLGTLLTEEKQRAKLQRMLTPARKKWQTENPAPPSESSPQPENASLPPEETPPAKENVRGETAPVR